MSEPLSDRSPLSDVLSTLGIHQHLCVIYETREQLFAVTVPFLKNGLERGEKCLYIADENTATSILDAMRGQGVDIDAPVKQGMLAVVNKGGEYLRKGYFDPDEMIHYLAGNVRGAKQAGYPAFRFAGEMTWALGGDPGVDRLIEYEARLNQFLSEHDALCVCQYNNKRFAPETILQILRTHPLVIYGGHVCKNPYFVPPDEFLKPNQQEAEVHRLLDNIQKYEMVERALRTARDEWEQSFNAISDFVCILDTSGAILRANKSMRERFEPIHGNLTGLNFHDVFWGRGQRDPAAPWETTISRGAPASFETELPPLGGWYLVSSYPLYDDQQQPWGAIFMARDITKRKRAEQELEKLSGRLLKSQDEERRKIARDLHDSTGQELVALATTVGQLRRFVPVSNKKARKLLLESQALADQCLREIRTLAYLLHPPMLEESGLEEAIREYAQGFQKRSRIKVKLELSPNLGRLPRDEELALFRVVQECLTNVQRHSGSTEARIRMKRDPQGIQLEVSDKKTRKTSRSGRKRTRKFSSQAGVGIPSMAERVKQIGGRMEIHSGREGTTVRVIVPTKE